MARNAVVDGTFYGVVAVLFLVLGIYLVVDSIKNRGFEFGLSFQMLMLAIVTILGFFAALRNRRSKEVDAEPEDEEL